MNVTKKLVKKNYNIQQKQPRKKKHTVETFSSTTRRLKNLSK